MLVHAEPGAVARYRQRPGQQRGQHGHQARPPDQQRAQQHHEQDREQRQPHRPEQRGDPQQEGGRRRAGRPPFARCPQQQVQGEQNQEAERDVGHCVGFELELVRVEEHRDGGERRRPGGQPETARQQVDEHAHGQAHHVLHGGDQREAVQRSEHPQHEAVAAHPAGVGDQPQPGGQVRGRVAAEPHDRPEGQRGQHPDRERRDQHQPEQPVPPCPRRQPNRVH